jgi:hypothetical protein
MPAVPPMTSFSGASDPVSASNVVFQPIGVIRSTSRPSAGSSLPGANSLSAIASPAKPSEREGSRRRLD